MSFKTGAHHWSTFAQRWAQIRPPARPHPQDIRCFETCVADLARRRGALDALLLGVTPEIAAMRWPAETTMLAVDRSIEATQAIWPLREIAIPAAAIVGRWERLPFRDASLDLVIGDGCLTALGTLAAQRDVTRELARVLRPGGEFIMRLFAAPIVRESVQSVFDDLRAGVGETFDVLKWRLLMAAPADTENAVLLSETFNLWDAADIDRSQLAAARGWERGTIDTIDAYRDSHVRLAFPPVDEALDRLAPYFRPIEQFTQSYELAERCPIVVLARDGDASAE